MTTDEAPVPGLVSPKAFSHVCIAVADAERSLGFYRRVFGFDVVFDVELEGEALEAVTGGAAARGRMIGGLLAGVMVELLQLAPAGRGDGAGRTGVALGYTNISVSVDGLDHVHASLREAGVDVDEPVEIGGVRMFFVRDPDGTPVEIVEYPGGAATSGELWRGVPDPS